MIHLFFRNIEIELSEEVSIALTKQFEDIENLTDIKNSWTKTIKVPATARNNKIFDLFNLNSNISLLNDPLYGRYDFHLNNDTDVIMIGYAQLNNLSMTGQFGYYEFNLYGELGNVLLEAQNFTFEWNDAWIDESNRDKQNYWIDGGEYFKKPINSSLIWSSWNRNRTDDDIIGWIPNNAYSDNFDYKTFEYIDDNGVSKTYLFTDTLNGVEIEKYTGVDSETIVGDGLLPRQIGEFRSYQQIPYIYFPKLLQIFIDKLGVNYKTRDYKVILDDKWFNKNNPYYYDQVMLLKSLKISSSSNNNDNNNNKYTDPKIKVSGKTEPDSYILGSWLKTEVVDYTYKYLHQLYFTEQKEITSIYNDGVFDRDPNITNLYEYSFTGKIGDNGEATRLAANNGLLIYVKLVDADTNTVLKSYGYGFLASDFSGILPTEIIGKDYIIKRIDDLNFSCYGTHFLKIGEFPNTKKVKIMTETGWLYNKWPLRPIAVSGTLAKVTIDKTSVLNINLNDDIISNKIITLSDLWSSGSTIYDKIIEYCKIFRILIDVDPYAKTITFKQAKNYFAESNVFNGGVEKWDDKIDYSKQYTINPFVWNYKYLKFNYDDSKTKAGEDYKLRTGYNYGEMRLVTPYDYNNETNDMFKKIKNTIEITESTLSWDTLYKNQTIIYTVPDEITLYSKDEDNKFVDCFGQWAFYDGLKPFDTALRQPKITDDTDLEIQTGKFFYGQSAANGLLSLTFPSIRIKKGDYIDLFTTPLINYTTESYDGAQGIYDRIWANYCNEKFEKNNKILTCYLKLSPEDVQKWKPNKFVQIGNQLFLVNKIIDYDPTKNEPTKCELITIQTPENYIK